MLHEVIETLNARVAVRTRYDNFIGGDWVAPVDGRYFDNISPVTGKSVCQIARSQAADIDLALDAAHKAREAWANTAPAERAKLLNKIADRMEENLQLLAAVETIDNGKPIRETTAADVPLAIDHFRYFASCVRAQEGALSEIDHDTVAYHFHEPLGVVGQIIPWNFPLLMASWKLAPALGAGNCVVMKPAEQTPMSIMVLMDVIGDILPPGVLNVVNGFGVEAGKPLAQSPRIAKIAFTGETTTGRLIMQYASENLIPVTLELGGKSPNIFFADVMAEDDDYFDKALEGFAMFALNQGEVCTCPSRALVQESIYDRFIEKAIARVEKIKLGNPLDMDTMIGAQASNDQLEKILSYVDIGNKEGAELLTGGERVIHAGDLAEGYYMKPTVFSGHNKMRIFQEEIFGPVLSVTTFKDDAEALEIANDTLYGLGSGVWTRNINRAYHFGRGIQAGRVWTNCYHLYPAHAAFGGYKKSGIGRETHKMMLDHYQQTKNLLVSYSPKALGFF
ncbi:MAG: aldehyde dehydrogenase [Methyloceanibacter sp.]|uniref:aldehyde dehydrogenase n=1 Tax=Methyloceanibacter sp. TaxID=1965321 RepID=UPI001D48CD5F|nr:aldehyde dehydrogenase [Methyloceanibacter sp.]MCB1442424.1 aldehyde dehydrogenase [Methyloceanibacter sp.]MCC0059005.1 aldehyde dehydrogenase [Hyphomicrobiaceae bacterium]